MTAPDRRPPHPSSYPTHEQRMEAWQASIRSGISTTNTILGVFLLLTLLGAVAVLASTG